MSSTINIKKLLCLEIDAQLNARISDTNDALAATLESRDSESKSSAGDKYETGREMIQIEIGKYQDQLEKYVKLKEAVSKIDCTKINTDVSFGSLVFTNQGKYIISVGLGVVNLNNEKFFAISLASPIGQELEGKTVGEKVKFQNREISIVEIQ